MGKSQSKPSSIPKDTKQKQTNIDNGNTHLDEKAANAKAIGILKTGDTEKFVKHVFTGENGETLTYAQMRERYG